jgi:hypothetical protein
MRTHLRDVKIDRLVKFVSTIAVRGETPYEILRNDSEILKVLSPGTTRKQLAKGTFYRYILACQELGFIEKTNTGVYRVTDAGIALDIVSQKQGIQSIQIKRIIRSAFLHSSAVKESFVSLFTCGMNKPLWEGKPIAYSPIQDESLVSQYKVYQWCSNTEVFFNESETRAILWGLRLVAMDLELIDELAVPGSVLVPSDRTVIVYPLVPDIRSTSPMFMGQAVLSILHDIVSRTSQYQGNGRVCLVALSDILYLLCPLLGHRVSLVREELTHWIEANETWIRAEKVSSFVSDYSYVQRGLHRRFGKEAENTFIILRDYKISHLAFRYETLLSVMMMSREEINEN